MAEHLTELEIRGELTDEAGMPTQLDTFAYDGSGKCYALTIMTHERYDDVKDEMPDGHEEEGAARVYIINEPYITLDSLTELLKSPDIRVFSPYLQPLEPTN